MRTVLRVAIGFFLPLGILFLAAPLSGLTDFYNLDHGRPIRVEDAYTTKQGAFELQLSPVSLAQDQGGSLRYSPSLELKYGLVRGVEVSLGGEFESTRNGSETDHSFGDAEISSLVNLWVEGAKLPAAAIRITGRKPMRSERSGGGEISGILTRGLTGPLRGHINGGTAWGEEREEDWWIGAALDYVLPFHHTLLVTEMWMSGAAARKSSVHSAVGTRIQIAPTLLVDAGVGRDLSGDSRRSWTMTLGATYEFGVRALTGRGNR
jgi:hypothetical protein